MQRQGRPPVKPSSWRILVKHLFEALETRRLLTTLLPDLDFGENGTVTVDFGSTIYPLASGKIVALGGGYRTLLGDGSPDPASGDDYTGDTADTALTADGTGYKIISEPSESAPGGAIATIYKFNPGGDLDTTFGTGGPLTINLPQGTGAGIDTVTADEIEIQADGKIVIAGRMSSSTDIYANNAYVMRLTAAGALDTSFGTNGVKELADPEGSFSRPILRLDAAGRALVYSPATLSFEASGYLTRLTTAGAVDTTFGTAGSVSVDGGNGLFEVDGNKPVTAVVKKVSDTVSRVYITRYTDTGTLDTTFGTAGVASLANAARNGGADLDTDASHRVVISLEEGVYRLTAAGALDSSFGTGGAIPLPLEDSGGLTFALQVDVINDNKVLLSDGRTLLQLVPRANVALSGVGSLVATGTSAADTITVSQTGGTVSVDFNGTTTTYAAADIKAVSINGGAGNDTLALDGVSIDLDNVTLLGGLGNDTYQGDSVTEVVIDDRAGNSTVTFADTAITFYSTATSADTITLTGAKVAEIHTGFGSNVATGSGDDLISFLGQSTVSAGAGNDTIYNDFVRRPGGEVVGTAVPTATRGSVVNAGNGNDRVILDTNPLGATISGGAGADFLSAALGDNVIDGNEGNDDIRTGVGDDTLSGNAGKDTIRGGAGDDALAGNGGNDRLFGQDGRDQLFGAAGNDAIAGGAGADRIGGGSGTNYILGEGGDDVLGSAGPSTLIGGSGNDVFYVRNSVIDLIDGLAGTDAGQIDSNDAATSLETLLA